MWVGQAPNDATYSPQQNTTPDPVGVAKENCKPPIANEGKGPEDDFNVLALDDLDLHSMSAQVVTNAEIYVRNMLCARAGLACWSPRPRKPFTGERGVVPGDVGTYDLTDGFKTIFNIWRDEALLKRINTSGLQSCKLPPNDTMFHLDELKEGATIVSGTSSNVHESEDGRITSFEFHCTSEQGAVFASTSSADLEELVHPIALRDFLVQYAGIIYQHANAVRRVADEDSLYIVSGCIKSDSWALAAYKEPAQAPHDVLKLVRKATANRVDQIPTYMWTLRGTAEARSDSTSTPVTSERHQKKDQCLFLRGFKLCFSKDFRLRLKDPPLKFDHDPDSKDATDSNPEGPDTSQGGHGQGRSDSANSKNNESQGSGTSSAKPPSSSRNLSLEIGIRIYSFPPSSDKVWSVTAFWMSIDYDSR
ncbi:hypothetical protein EST38_g12811 [Candolleomyces aberdarensis]|uniref:Uncharacterized protein n=1 Tax=Candolleomyces aberdarensis TaxID=2316362 RepID=A0A4Q2D1J0_9AGAR|nr:hypothetical protein EST38_g12811 [Candolleomyces aberdarensis]